MMAIKPLIIIPSFRKDFTANVVNNLKRQVCRNFRVIIVENGNAVGEYKKLGFETIQSESNVWAARNAGLIYAKENYKDGFFVFMDDDDLYGKNYISEIIENAKKAEIVGKTSIYYKLSNIVTFMDSGIENTFSERPVHGPTMSGWVNDAEFFPKVNVWGEDFEWQRIMLNKGAKIYSTSSRNFLGVRHGNHTWSLSDRDVVRTFSGRVHLASGSWDIPEDNSEVTFSNLDLNILDDGKFEILAKTQKAINMILGK